jgi:hypothetical protein
MNLSYALVVLVLALVSPFHWNQMLVTALLSDLNHQVLL